MSANEVLTALLDAMPDSYQKTIGFPTYDLLAAVSLRLAETDAVIEDARAALDPENLTGGELDRYIYPRSGIARKAATFAGGVQFAAAETVAIDGTGEVPVTCRADGTAGNLPAHSVTQMPVTVQGITGCDNEAEMSGGYAEETDAEYYARFLLKMRTPATSGNVYHYEQWALECAGVGHVKVFPRVQGVNTVDVVIADSTGQPAGEELVAAVQAYIDPESEGAGRGQAPIGAQCFVSAAAEKKIVIACKVFKSNTAEADSVTAAVKAAVAAYLAGTVFVQNYVSYAQIAAAILSAEGVVDFEGLTVGGGTANIAVGERECPVLGEVTITYG